MRPFLLIAGAAALAAGTAQAQTTTPAPAGAPAAPAAQTTTAAPAAANVQAGATVVDATGAAVGTVAQVSGGTAVVDTGTNKVGVPVGNFAAGPNGLVLGNTKAELDAAASQAAAQSAAQLKTLMVAGTEVHGLNGKVLGTVKAAAADYVTVTSAKGGDVRLPASGFAAGPNGLTLGLSAEQFDAAVASVKK
jgi:hypothetical protein